MFLLKSVQKHTCDLARLPLFCEACMACRSTDSWVHLHDMLAHAQHAVDDANSRAQERGELSVIGSVPPQSLCADPLLHTYSTLHVRS